MKPELMYLVWVSTLTAVLWIPYILERIRAWGLLTTVGYSAGARPVAAWSARLKAAHTNAVENLVVFAALVLAADAAAISNDTTVMACQLYFWARVVHLLAYTLGIPWVRTLAFVAGFAGQIMLVCQLL